MVVGYLFQDFFLLNDSYLDVFCLHLNQVSFLYFGFDQDLVMFQKIYSK